MGNEESKKVEIPIEEFEDDMVNLSQEKKTEIINIFKNAHITNTDYYGMKSTLHRLCKKCDIERLEYLMRECISIYSNHTDMHYRLNKKNKTASLFSVRLCYGTKKILIPRSIAHDGNLYLITSITGLVIDYYEKTPIEITFEDNSAIKTIYSLDYLPANCIKLPASVIDLQSRWCSNVLMLTKIIVPPENKRFIFKDDKYLLGKTDNDSDVYDTLLFARRDIKESYIPSNIKMISSYAFQNCKNLTKIEFQSDSNLQTIDSYAFSYANIQNIHIPSSVSKIGSNSFSNCQLTNVEFSSKSILNTIDKFSFYRSKITNIFIPSSVTTIEKSSFSHCYYLNKVEFQPNSKLEKIGKNAFASTNIIEISIPFNVTTINESAFSWCRNLTKVEFAPNSKLKIIEKSAFESTKIREISIPSSVSIICEKAFEYSNLAKIEFSSNSNLQLIEFGAFSSTNIEEIFLPSSLIELKGGCFYGMKHLKKIKISPDNNRFIFKDNKYLLCKTDNNSDDYDILHFAHHNIKEAHIPKNIKVISAFAFTGCENLTNLYFPSNLSIIGECAFQNTNIKEISIQSSLKNIGKCAFKECKNLRKVIFHPNSKLETIEIEAFRETNIIEISIPSSVSAIGKAAFKECKNLRKVEFLPNSNLETIEYEAFRATNINDICIPSSVSIIGVCAFEGCKNLRKVEFLPNSNLKIISGYAFKSTDITQIYIPSNVSKIDKTAFSHPNFKLIEIEEGSKIHYFLSDLPYNSIVMIPVSLKNQI